MIIESQLCDERIHQAATSMAWRLLDVCSGILMESEFLKQTYTLAREALEAFEDGRTT